MRELLLAIFRGFASRRIAVLKRHLADSKEAVSYYIQKGEDYRSALHERSTEVDERTADLEEADKEADRLRGKIARLTMELQEANDRADLLQSRVVLLIEWEQMASAIIQRVKAQNISASIRAQNHDDDGAGIIDGYTD